MRPEEPRFRLGRLHVEGETFEFVAETADFAVPKGDLALIGVAYNYAEASTAREDVMIVLTVTVDGQPPMRLEHNIRDRPFHMDDEVGFLSVPLRFGSRGALRGRFSIRVDYEAKGGGHAPVHHERVGDFQVRVQ